MTLATYCVVSELITFLSPWPPLRVIPNRPYGYWRADGTDGKTKSENKPSSLVVNIM